MARDARVGDQAVEELRRHKVMFDNTWTLATLLATVLAVAWWELGLAQFAVAPVIWALAALAAIQYLLNSQARGATSATTLRHIALGSQLLGTALIAVSWHLFGGIQQPLYPLIIVLPLLTGTLVLTFWQQQIALVAILLVLASGVFSPPTPTPSSRSARHRLASVICCRALHPPQSHRYSPTSALRPL